MKIYPEPIQRYRYRALWQKVIRKVIFSQKIIKIMRTCAGIPTEEADQLICRSSCLPKTEEPHAYPTTVMRPDSKKKEAWNIFMGFLLMYTAVVTPFSLSFFDLTSGDTLFKIDILLDVCFIIDLLININTAFYNEDNTLITSRKLILKNYAKHGLFLDMFSSFPFSILDLGSQGYSTAFRVLRLRTLGRLIKLSKLFKVVNTAENSLFKHVQNLLGISHMLVRILKFLGMLFVAVHLAACIWHFLAKSQDYDVTTWVYNTGNLDSPIYRLYMLSLYWTLVTLATIGYGDIRPFSDSEKIFSIFWMIFALYFLSFSISSLSSMLSQIDIRKNLLRHKMAFVDDFAKEVKLSKRLKKELQRLLLNSIDRFNYSYEDRIALVNEFPNDLKLEIASTMENGMAVRFDLFINESDHLIQEILPLMQNLSISASQTVYSAGESATKIYFVIRGRVHFLLKNEKTVFQVLSEKGYFGDIEVMFGIHRRNSAVTATECRFMILGMDIIKKIQKHFPGFYRKMKGAARARLIITRKAKMEMKALVRLNKSENIATKELGEIREVIRRKTACVDFKKMVSANKVMQKVMARESLRMTTEYLEECKDEMRRINEMMSRLRNQILNNNNIV